MNDSKIKMKGNYFYILLFICFHISAIGQEPQPHFINYNEKNGLPSSEVYDGLQDRNGFLWFATDRGISMYNGYEFKTYTMEDGLTDNVVFELYEDKKGRIWLLTMNGQLCYIENGKIEVYKYNAVLEKNQKKLNVFHSFYVDQVDNIFIGSNGNGLISISNKGVVKVKNESKNKPAFVFEKVEGKWMSYYSKYKNSDIKSFPYSYYLRDQFLSYGATKPIRSKFFSLGENKAVFNKHSTLVLFDEVNTKILDTVSFERRITGMRVIGKEIFVGIQDGGGYFYTCNKGKLVLKRRVLNSYTCSNYFRDKEGGYWILTVEKGIFYVPSMHISSYTKNEGLYLDHIEKLGLSDKGLLIGYKSDMQRLDDRVLISIFDRESHFVNEFIKKKDCIIYYQGWKLINTCKGFIYPINKPEVILSIQIKDTVYYLFAGNCGYKLCDDKIIRFDLNKKFGHIDAVEMIDKNTFWIGNVEGLFKIMPDTAIDMSTINPLFSHHVIDLAKTKNYGLVIATRGAGLLFMKDEKVWTINTKNGLSTNDITNLYVDFKENIWVCTNNGLYQIDAKFPEIIEHYTDSDGLISNETTDVRRIKNKVYIGTKWGLSVIDLETYQKDASQVKMKIIGFKINNAQVEVKAVIDIFPSDKNFEIDYLGLNYRAMGNIEYRYRIKELTDEWQYTKNRNFQLLTLPDNGTYTIEIEGRKLPHDLSSKSKIGVTLVFHPPFWKTIWFQILVGIVLITFIFILIRMRINRLVKQKGIDKQLYDLESKALRSQMNPHFIFNVLGAIQRYVSERDVVSSEIYLTKFARLIRLILENSRKTYVPFEEELEMIEHYIEMEKMRFNGEFNYHISVDENIDVEMLKIPPMLIQPYIENAILHGFKNKKTAGKIELKFSLSKDVLTCLIEDNGSGYDQLNKVAASQRKKQSLGMLITHERLQLLKDQSANHLKMEVENVISQTGTGTKVLLRIPVQ